MIETTDGTFAQAAFEKLPRAEATRLRDALQRAIHVALEGTAQEIFLGFPQQAQALGATLTDEKLLGIMHTALDAAMTVYIDETPREVDHPSAAAAVIAGAIGTSAAGISVGKVRHDSSRAGSGRGAAEAGARGNPPKMVRRVEQHLFWRAFGKLGRSLFRGIGGKR